MNMFVLTILTWASLLVHISIAFISIIAGLYYLAELVEEYTVLAKKLITWLTISVLAFYVALFLGEDFPSLMLLCGIAESITHLLILKKFPYVELTSPLFIFSIVLLLLNHYLAFRFFSGVFYSFSEIMAYFTVCLWLIPFLLLLSLSANDYVLPLTMNEESMGNTDVVRKYFLKKGKKYGLLTFFNHFKDSILPERTKKSF